MTSSHEPSITQLSEQRERPQGEHNLPNVEPAECMLYFNPLFFSSRWTSAICADTEAVGVPSGMRQKSAVHFGGVPRLIVFDDIVVS